MTEMLCEEMGRLLAEAKALLSQARSVQELEKWRVQFLGRKSRLSEVLKNLPQVPDEQRPAIGKQANHIKATLESCFRAKQSALAASAQGPRLDVTLPGSAIPQGRLHPITQTIEEVLSIFVPMGFEIAEGPEMELERYNFDGLNIPQDHPSRESFDTFFLKSPSPDPKKLGRHVLRSHTSPVQIRVMQSRKPPLRIVVPGRVYRPDPLDANHSFMFHQVEGLLVDEQTSFADLKGVLASFIRRFFGPNTQMRFRPHFFPFTEPSAEVDIACANCRGDGCATCGRKGWLEILGCGMVHPNVFRAVGYDPSRVQGFAFGMGVERMAMLRHGIIDIRWFFENDVRFLEQF